ncbi:uncharacterized protein LOC111638484 isoform X2 [Centruroides sculpturatus]|uniref:uncharacterized protein LOC111638484 isoform X2 n=1 Tax=Centruroides sculpturatus TaxID=218467 RepID=UPI000C6D6AAF|nr:uncharacterized protein LOC111638484 isoform X2 [Centruroides sculpturatus]
MDKLVCSIQNTNELVNGLLKGKIKKTFHIMSLDIKSTYPSTILEMIIESLSAYNIPEYIIKLIEFIFNNNYLKISTDYYRQKKGIAMGPVIGPKLADIYMITIDERILTLTVSSKDIEDYANRLQENLNFTNEDEQQQELNFLDVVIKREETRVLFQTKKNVFIMELRKILNRTTLQENIDIEIKQLFKKFLLNDNPKYILCKWYNSYLNYRFNVKNEIKNVSYIKFPYVINIFEKYKLIFKEFSICIVANQKNKMLNVISIVNNEDTNMHKDQFKIAGVVYRMSCTCQNPNYYIGETGRKLELRINTRQLSDLEGWNRCGSYIVMNLIVI